MHVEAHDMALGGREILPSGTPMRMEAHPGARGI